MQASPDAHVSTANGHFQNYRFVGHVTMSHLDMKIRRGRECLLIVDANLVPAGAMVAPRLVIVPGIRTECVEKAIEVM